MKADKEAWKEEVMQSLNGIQRAEISPFIFTRIQEKTKHSRNEESIVPLPKLAMAFAAVLLLCALNVSAIKHFVPSKKMQQNAYSFSNINYNLY